MARTSDILVAFMAAHGNHALASGHPIPYTRLRKMYASDEACAGCARFWDGGAKSLNFEAWAATRGVERVGMIHPARVLAAPPRLTPAKSSRVVLRRS